jgi:hypothetical protein
VLKRVLDCLDEGEAQGWELVTDKKGVKVHKKTMASITGKASRYCCVKASHHPLCAWCPADVTVDVTGLCICQATGVINASASEILKLFEDNSRVAEYNPLYNYGRDLEEINENTKVGTTEASEGGASSSLGVPDLGPCVSCVCSDPRWCGRARRRCSSSSRATSAPSSTSESCRSAIYRPAGL